MALTGKQKAALLLMSLDATTASELLKGVDTRTVQDLAVELTYLDASGNRDISQSAEAARQFCDSLRSQSGFHLKSFLGEMLRNTVGEDQAHQIESEIGGLLRKRDPFLAIRSAQLPMLASVLEGEHPQAAAVVLSELPPKRSSEIVGLLGEGMRLSAISRMTNIGSVSPEAKGRIAEMISQRLEEAAAAQDEGEGVIEIRPEQSLRKVAVILRNLEKDLRDGVISAISQKDKDAAQNVSDLMVVWDDIPEVADRSMQQALRGFDERQLALALHEADEVIVQRIRANISERAAAMVDEEASLMSSPKKEEIGEAREKIVSNLRDLNRKGELSFIE